MYIPALKNRSQLQLTSADVQLVLGGDQAARTNFPVASDSLAEKLNVFQMGQVKPSGQRSERL